ncbi:LysR family transcriptional regulator [Streptomyces capparidis]
MEIRQLRYFVAVAETGGFGSAARSLHIVQAAVSQQIHRLERSLGVRLFDRSTRHVRLTPAGERLLTEARAVLAAVEHTRAVAAGLAAERGHSLRLGTTRAFDTRTHLLLDAFTRAAPEVRVRLHPGSPDERLAGVRSGALDAAVVRALDGAPGLVCTPLWTERLIAAVPAGHPLAEHGTLRLGQLADLPLRLAPRGKNPPFHDLITSACREEGFTPVPGPSFTTFQGTLHAIGTEAPSWTVFYPLGDPPVLPRTAQRLLAGPRVTAFLVTRPGQATAPLVRQLTAAARSQAGRGAQGADPAG